MLPVPAFAAEPPTLEEAQWEHRLVVLVASEADEGRVVASREVLERHAEGMAERKLHVVTLLAGKVTGLRATSVELQKAWTVSDDTPFQALLVGLDGGVKARTREVLDLPAWFERIDSMPMRKEELRRAVEEPAGKG